MISNKFINLAALIGCFTLLSCSDSQPAKEEEIEWKGDFAAFEESFEQKYDLDSFDESSVLYLKGEKSPFSGSVEKNSTSRLSVDKYEDGLLDGLSIRKSADGSWVEANYKAGKLHGKMTFYDKSGKVRSEMNYENGTLLPINTN